MGQPTGQRVSLLTFSGLVKVNTRQSFSFAGGSAVLTKTHSQELSSDSSEEFLGARDEESISNVYATGTLTLTGQPLDTETVTIGSKVYTFQTTLTNVDGNVQIGGDASASLDNLIAAINLGAGSGTAYAAATTTSGVAGAAAGAGDTMDITATAAGTAGNTVITSETLTNGSWGSATLLGGVNAVSLEDTNGHYTITAI